MHFIIREAVSDDATALTGLSNQLGYTITEASTKQNLEVISGHEGEILLVAMHEKELVGWIHVFQTTRLEAGSFCEIGGLVVNDKHRRMGVGKLLVEQAKYWCLRSTTRTLRVRCNIKRIEAHAFYEALGFAEHKQQKIFEMTLPPV